MVFSYLNCIFAPIMIYRNCMMKRYSHIIFLVLLFFVQTVAKAQMVTGIVTDSISKEPVAYLAVYYDGTGIGSITDIDGKFSVEARKDLSELTFSAVGYNTKVVKIVPGVAQELNVTVSEASVELSEVVIKPERERYSRKNNPAVELMKKVIEHKSLQNLADFDYYSYDIYQKMTTSLNDITPDMFDKGMFKKMPFLVDQVEPCIETNKLILPFSIQEVASQKVYRREPESEKTIIKGMNASGVDQLFSTGEMFGTLLQDIFADVNIYDNDIKMLQSRFVSPISSTSGISFYKYYIMDTVRVDTDSCVHLTFVPQNPQDFGFTGHLYVLADSTYAVKKCVMNLPKNTGVNFVESLTISQEFAQLPNGKWVLKNDDMLAELFIVKAVQGVQVRRTTRYDNFNFDEISSNIFRLKGDVVKENDAMMKSDEFWADVRQVPMSKQETMIDRLVERLEQVPGFKFVVFVAKAFIENFVETGVGGKPSKFDIGPINTIFSTNDVDGFRLRLSGQTTAKLHPNLFFSGYAAYGFRDKRMKYKGKVEYSFDKKEFLPREFPKNCLSFSYQYDVMSPMDKFLKTDKDNVFVAWKATTVDQMMYVRDIRMEYEKEWVSGLSMKLSAINKQDEPTSNLHYILNDGLSTEIKKMTTMEFGVSLSYAPGETYLNSKQRRRPVNLDAPVFTFVHNTGVKGFLGGDYNYNYTELGFSKRFWLSSWGKVDINLKGGIQWNKVPFPLLIMPDANLSYITQKNTFNLINNMEFLSDRFASLMLTYDLNGKLFNRIPLLKKLKWREVVRFNMFYGKLSDKNNPFKNPGDNELYLFPTRNGEYTSFVMDNMPYMEVCVGIHNIFKILHIEYVRRLTYLNNPGINKNGVRLMMMVTF